MTRVGIEKYIVFVPNTFGPYGYEMVQILAYPNGFRFRFRFEQEWVHEKVKNRLEDLEGLEGYILLRDFASAELYPVRFVALKSARKVGPIYFFEYELGEIMDVGSEEVRDEQYMDFRRRFDEFHPDIAQANRPNNHLSPLVFLSNFSPDLRNEKYVKQVDEDPESTRWINIVSSTTSLEYFQNVEFLRILSLSDHSKNGASPEMTQGSWSLKEGHTYTLKVVQFIPHATGSRNNPNDIKIKADEAVVKVVRGEQRAVGKYDILSFVLRVHPTVRQTFSLIDLEYSPNADLLEKIEPRISIPIQIQRSLKPIGWRILWAVFFLGLYLFPFAFSNAEFSLTEISGDVAIIGLAISLFEVIRMLSKWGRS